MRNALEVLNVACAPGVIARPRGHNKTQFSACPGPGCYLFVCFFNVFTKLGSRQQIYLSLRYSSLNVKTLFLFSNPCVVMMTSTILPTIGATPVVTWQLAALLGDVPIIALLLVLLGVKIILHRCKKV